MELKYLIVLFHIFTFACGATRTLNNEFENFKKRFNKRYENDREVSQIVKSAIYQSFKST